MKKNTAQVVIAILISLFNISYGIAQDNSQIEEFDQILNQLITEHGNVGVTAGYSVSEETKWSNSFGYSSKEDKVAFTSLTKVRTASMAKSMTAIAIMQLVEEGLLDIDVPIQLYLPNYPKKITTRQLLSHTSGVPAYASSKEAESKIEFPSLKDAIKVFEHRELEFEPGSQYKYTTYGYVVLGRIIESISGMTYEAYMQENIWNVVGMKDTGVEKHDKVEQNESKLYHKKRKKAKRAKRNNLSNRTPGGGFYSTLEDMIRFGEGILNNSFVKRNTLDEMLKVASPGKVGNQYGFGFFLYGPKGQEGAVFGHSGGQTGASTQFFIHLPRNIVVVVLANTSGTWEHVAGAASKIINLASELDEQIRNREGREKKAEKAN